MNSPAGGEWITKGYARWSERKRTIELFKVRKTIIGIQGIYTYITLVE